MSYLFFLVCGAPDPVVDTQLLKKTGAKTSDCIIDIIDIIFDIN